jgi:hypothetical protein
MEFAKQDCLYALFRAGQPGAQTPDFFSRKMAIRRLRIEQPYRISRAGRHPGTVKLRVWRRKFCRLKSSSATSVHLPPCDGQAKEYLYLVKAVIPQPSGCRAL